MDFKLKQMTSAPIDTVAPVDKLVTIKTLVPNKILVPIDTLAQDKNGKLTISFFANFCISAILVAAFSSCGPVKVDMDGDDGQIGEPLSKLSGLSSFQGESQGVIGIYDETVKKIQIFNLKDKLHVASLDTVESKTEYKDHFVLYGNEGKYAVDITTQGIAIISQDNKVVKDPIVLVGKPISAAFDSSRGHLVIYDDAGSVGLLHLDGTGRVIKSKVRGSRLNGSNGPTISSGDLLEDGNLVLSMSDGTIALVDFLQSLNGTTWVYSSKVTGLPLAQWVSRIPGQANQILLRIKSTGGHSIYIYDMQTETVLSTYAISGYVEKSSRNGHPHLVLSPLDSNSYVVVYPVNGVLQSVQRTRYASESVSTVLNSRLSLVEDSFSYVEAVRSSGFFDENWNYNSIRENRTFNKFSLSEMLLQSKFSIPNGVLIELSEDHLLALYPHRLGYAVSFELDSANGQSRHEFRFFNRRWLKK